MLLAPLLLAPLAQVVPGAPPLPSAEPEAQEVQGVQEPRELPPALGKAPSLVPS